LQSLHLNPLHRTAKLHNLHQMSHMTRLARSWSSTNFGPVIISAGQVYYKKQLYRPVLFINRQSPVEERDKRRLLRGHKTHLDCGERSHCRQI